MATGACEDVTGRTGMGEHRKREGEEQLKSSALCTSPMLGYGGGGTERVERGEPRPPEPGVAAGETWGWELALDEGGCSVVMPGGVEGTRLTMPKEAGTRLVKTVANGEEVEVDGPWGKNSGLPPPPP